MFDAPNYEHVIYQHDPPIADVFIGGQSIQASAALSPRLFSHGHHDVDTLRSLSDGIPKNTLPKDQHIDPAVSHAPKRTHGLTAAEKRLAVENALRCAILTQKTCRMSG